MISLKPFPLTLNMHMLLIIEQQQIFKQKAYQACVDDCSMAISIDPNYAYAYLNRGNAKELLRNDEGACQDWNKAVELGAESARSHIGICQ